MFLHLVVEPNLPPLKDRRPRRGDPMKNAMEILAACMMVGLICLPALREWLGRLRD